jgi:DNA repair protein RadA
MTPKKTEDKFALENLKGVGPITARKLREAGITDMLNLVIRSPVEIKELTGMDKEAANDVVEKSRALLIEEGLLSQDFVNAEELEQTRIDKHKISTGTIALNSLFGGGIETQAITEIYGMFGSGKTQLAHTLAVIVQQPEEFGGLNGGVLYIDTENTFRPDRIRTIATERGFDADKCIKGITVARAINSAHQLLLLETAGDLIQKNNIKLIVVDSITGNYRAEYLGRGTLADRQQTLNKFVHLLSRTAETYNLAAIATNQVMTSPGIMFGDPVVPIGGNILAHTSTYRVYFKKSGKKRVARMVDSPSHAEAEVVFTLGASGIMDTEEYLEEVEKFKAKEEKKKIKEEEEDVKTVE